jgi:hypothetical protein
MPGWLCLLLPTAALALGGLLGLLGELFCPRVRTGGGG